MDTKISISNLFSKYLVPGRRDYPRNKEVVVCRYLRGVSAPDLVHLHVSVPSNQNMVADRWGDVRGVLVDVI